MSFVDALRSKGLTVKPYSGWETRSAPIPSYLPDGFNPIGSLAHWDAIKTWPGPGLYANNPRFDQPTYHTAIEKDGTVHLISQGYVYGAGGGDRDVFNAMRYDISPVPPARAEKSWNGNPHFYADVVNYWPDGKALPQAQYEALVTVEATRCVVNGWNPMTRINDHQGWSTRKADLSGRGWPAPKGWSIDKFRNDIRQEIGADMAFTAEEEHELKSFVAELKKLGSNAGFVPSLISDMRKDIITRDELVAAIDKAVAGIGGGRTMQKQVLAWVADALRSG